MKKDESKRVIKFRGFDKGPGEKGWVYGWVTPSMKVTLTGTEPRMMVAGYEVHDESVGQFTGLEDANHRRIYEGDIVEWNEARLLVEYNERCAAFVLKGPKKDFPMKASERKHYKVIGNSFENQELAEEIKWDKEPKESGTTKK